MDLDAYGIGGSSGSNKSSLLDQAFSPKTYNLRAAAVASAAWHAAELEAGVMDLDLNVNDYELMQKIVPDGGYDPERVMTSIAPPKRYFRTFWRSVSFRLLKQWADTAKQSRKAGAYLTRQVA